MHIVFILHVLQSLLHFNNYLSVCFPWSISYPENITPDSEGVEPKTMTIGINNVFEVGCGIL